MSSFMIHKVKNKQLTIILNFVLYLEIMTAESPPMPLAEHLHTFHQQGPIHNLSSSLKPVTLFRFSQIMQKIEKLIWWQ